MWGIVPAAGVGSRIAPLAFSKELLPVGSRFDGEIERPRAVSEYLVERMIRAGATKICFVISPGKFDILNYYGDVISFSCGTARAFYVVQPKPLGLCDSLFRALPLVHESERVLIGLPDTVWFPDDGLCYLPPSELAFLLFPVEKPQLFDAVETRGEQVVRVRVKEAQASTNWIWGAFGMPGRTFRELGELWQSRVPRDEYFGTLVNAFLERGGQALGIKRGEAYVDVGTLNGYREALKLLAREADGHES